MGTLLKLIKVRNKMSCAEETVQQGLTCTLDQNMCINARPDGYSLWLSWKSGFGVCLSF